MPELIRELRGGKIKEYRYRGFVIHVKKGKLCYEAMDFPKREGHGMLAMTPEPWPRLNTFLRRQCNKIDEQLDDRHLKAALSNKLPDLRIADI